MLEVILEGRGDRWLVDGLSRDKTNNSKGIEMKNSWTLGTDIAFLKFSFSFFLFFFFGAGGGEMALSKLYYAPPMWVIFLGDFDDEMVLICCWVIVLVEAPPCNHISTFLLPKPFSYYFLHDLSKSGTESRSFRPYANREIVIRQWKLEAFWPWSSSGINSTCGFVHLTIN